MPAEALAHADNRLRRTVRRLVLDPAGLTRNHPATIPPGRRTSEAAPLRLFPAILLLLFGIGALTNGRTGMPPSGTATRRESAGTLRYLAVPGSPRAEAATSHPNEVPAVMRD